ncbi:MAG: radical SAM protein [Polyangiales bacterium]
MSLTLEEGEGRFVAYVALSNWLRGFDRYRHCWDKALLTESRYPDAMYMHRVGEPCDVGLAKTRALIARLAIDGDAVVAIEARLAIGPTKMQPNTTTGTGVGWRWPASSVVISSVAWVDEGGAQIPTTHEEVTARAYTLADHTLARWSDVVPRALSVLPIARACQARCAFCFSKGSVSELARQAPLELSLVREWARLAAERGAERAVITGGGEPTLLEDRSLVAIVRALRERLGRVTLITNGARLDEARLRSLADAGLDVLACSRHGVTEQDDERIMGLSAGASRLAPIARALGVRARAVCVLSRDGVSDVAAVRAYLDRCAMDGFDEVCFKELYIASVRESPWAPSETNAYAKAKQVPLSIVLEALAEGGFREVARLPWGVPVFEGEARGRALRVAAYTEPSVGWERAYRLARSWNLLSDGRCFASLEDPSSLLSLRDEPARLSVIQ